MHNQRSCVAPGTLGNSAFSSRSAPSQRSGRRRDRSACFDNFNSTCSTRACASLAAILGVSGGKPSFIALKTLQKTFTVRLWHTRWMMEGCFSNFLTQTNSFSRPLLCAYCESSVMTRNFLSKLKRPAYSISWGSESDWPRPFSSTFSHPLLRFMLYFLVHGSSKAVEDCEAVAICMSDGPSFGGAARKVVLKSTEATLALLQAVYVV